MKYKVGDRVRIKSLDWYNENKDEYGVVDINDDFAFYADRSRYCGKVFTISEVFDNSYFVKEDNGDYYWTDEMIEGLVEEETLIERVDDKGLPFNEWLSHKGAFHVPDGYELKDENGNVINATKIVLEKKKKEYPKTYEECCKVLGIAVRDLDILNNMLDTTEIVYSKNLDRLLNSFRKLLICRDAYWKIAGEEMGLGKPWEPTKNKMVYSIYRHSNKIETNFFSGESVTFEFPTAKMLDAFKENFNPDIEVCKEFL